MKKLNLFTFIFLFLGIITLKGQYQDIHDFSGDAYFGNEPWGSLIIDASGNTLYGMTEYGQIFPYGYDVGIIFSINTNGSAYTPFYSFNGSSYDPTRGDQPYGSLNFSHSGTKLYGMATQGGTSDLGIIFSSGLAGGVTNLHNFDGAHGSTPGGALILNPAGTILYGMADGGANNDGCIFSYDIGSANYKDFLDFTGTSGTAPGANPYLGSLIFDPTGNILYGMTPYGGGVNNNGCIFSYTISTSTYNVICNFTGTSGAAIGQNPIGSLLLSNGVLYGMTDAGGVNNKGCIFSVHTDGTLYDDLFDFNGTNGEYPSGSLILSASGTALYGMTQNGGANGDGIIFSIQTNGTGFNDLHDFNGSAGNDPKGSLVLSNGVLYGMTSAGGANGGGVIFSDGICSESVSVNPGGSIDCNGSSVILNVNTVYPDLTYTWAPAAGLNTTNGTTVTASPLTTTEYTVTATSETGCSYTAVSFVRVDPLINILAATVSPNNVCVGTPITLSVIPSGGRPPYLYEWSGIGNSHVNNITIPAPANTTTYTVTVRDEYGCTASTTVAYTADPNCCYIAGGVNVLANSLSSNYSNSFGVAGSTPVTIAGTFTVNNNFTIDELTDVSMAAGAIIDVKPGAVLNITNGSRLYACGDMWQGIQVEQGGTLNIEGRAPSHFMPGIRTIVEDAIKGVEIKSTSNVNIYYSLLNNNLYDVYLDPPAEDLGIYNFHLRSSILTCEADGTYSPNAYLKSPYSGYITNSGVYMTNIGAISSSIQVGDYTSAGYQNTFSNMNYGVNATNSTFFVCNNMFEDLAGNSGYCIPLTTGACPPPIGIAVLANNTNPPYEDYESNLYYYEAIVGGTSANQGNIMLNCYRGVDITNYGFPYVVDNKITNTQDEYSMPHINAYPYGDHAIYLKDLSSPQVTGNTIQNYETGIHLSDFALVSDGPGTYTGYINNNVLDVSGRYGVMSTGILAEIALPPVGIAEPMYIEDNTVSNAGSSCITLNDVDAYLYDMYVTGNTLYILPSTSRTNNTQRSGVFVENSEDYLVYNNIIESPGTYVGTPAGAANTSVIGIRSYVSYGVYECNYINDVGECMMFEGACSPSTIYSNYFGESYNGFVLENNGVIGNQGNGTTPIGDVWQGPFYNFYTYTYNSYASDSWLYVINSSTENPATNPANDQTYCFCSGDNYVYNTNVFSATGTPLACPTNCGSCQVITPSTYRPLAEAVVQDSLPLSVFVPETQYIGQQSILEQINQNPGLMIGDSVLQNFYAAAPSTNMGTIYSINQAISSGNVTLAQSMNTALAPSNTIEQNHKSTNAIMLNTMAVHYDSLTPTQYDTLLSIALQCPLEGGKAVFHARAMLNRLLNTSILFTDSCHGMSSPPHRFHSRNTVAGLTNDIDTLSVKVYPNPANTMLNIEIGLQQGQVVNFVLYNNIGEEVENKNLNGDLTTLSLSNLPSGMYYYRIVNKNGNILKADKQLIIH